MISIKIILTCIIIQNMFMQFWLNSEFEELRTSIKSIDSINSYSHNTVDSLRRACFLQSRLENKRN